MMELLLPAMTGRYRVRRLKLPPCCKQLSHWTRYVRQLILGSEKQVVQDWILERYHMRWVSPSSSQLSAWGHCTDWKPCRWTQSRAQHEIGTGPWGCWNTCNSTSVCMVDNQTKWSCRGKKPQKSEESAMQFIYKNCTAHNSVRFLWLTQSKYYVCKSWMRGTVLIDIGVLD